MGNMGRPYGRMQKNFVAAFSECIAAAEGRIDGLWLIIAADLASAKYCRHPPILARQRNMHAVAPYELVDRQSLRPSMVSAGGQGRTGIAVRLLFQPLPALCNLRIE
ncbi:hypothetical protein GPL21_12665 [Bradyrhizobium pachyrhizi]|uniref:Uncharacterized protein n=1 Tax=Bradyrhizobium pachyrhizi TaxID=280333 RepID=A0A844SSX0_9BRAD|nr:hypothetical protein [Bradyrhizobium pachyrhizi]MVT65961.1 hypothetical protein [Bradyrhizobium pachyrhizi]